jgi:transcriptional regulator with XRE-family HTH domain
VLADKMKSLRERARLTQQELATKADLSWSMVAQIEQGRKPDLRVSTLIRLAVALGIRPTELFETFVEEGIPPRRKRGSEEPPEKPQRPGKRRGRPARVGSDPEPNARGKQEPSATRSRDQGRDRRKP